MKTFTIGDYIDGNTKHVNDIVLIETAKNKKDFKISEDVEALQILVKNVELTNRFELQYNMEKGIPYMQTIFQDSTRVSLWASYVQEAILKVDGIKDISFFDIKYIPEKKTLNFIAGINTIFGEMIFNG